MGEFPTHPGRSVLTEPIGSVLEELRFLENRNRSVLFKAKNRETSGSVLSVRFRL